MLETNRLLIKPLSYNQLLKYGRSDHSLEEELKLSPSTRVISPELKEALEQTILPNVADTSKDYLYSTLWTIISKERNQMVGDICFIGEPNANGEIEIGYGTYDEFRGKGFMTEAVGGMVQWVRAQPNVLSIIASTEKENVGSYKVLDKNGFLKVGETETLFRWKFTLK